MRVTRIFVSVCISLTRESGKLSNNHTPYVQRARHWSTVCHCLCVLELAKKRSLSWSVSLIVQMKLTIKSLPCVYRYGGFCPQFKFQLGETFGKTTNKLLKDSRVVTSGKLVLKDIKPVRPDSASNTRLLKKRAQGLGDQKLVDKMVPGYAGN